MRLRTVAVSAVLCVGSLGLAMAQSGWTLGLHSIGPVRVGMTPGQLSEVLGVPVVVPKDEDEHDCFYVEVPQHAGVSVMVMHGRVARVDVSEGATVTEVGVGIGASEAAIVKAYPRGLTKESSQNDGDIGGHYFTYRLPGAADAVRFETFDGKVTSFYAGTVEAVQLVEGCL